MSDNFRIDVVEVGGPGPVGPQGPTGPQGPQGIQGPTGLTGMSFPGDTIFAHLIQRNESPVSTTNLVTPDIFIADTNFTLPGGTWTLTLEYWADAYRTQGAAANYVIMWCRWGNADHGRTALNTRVTDAVGPLARRFTLTGITGGTRSAGIHFVGFGGSGSMVMNNGGVLIRGWRTA